jgi:hypothetical protein
MNARHSITDVGLDCSVWPSPQVKRKPFADDPSTEQFEAIEEVDNITKK